MGIKGLMKLLDESAPDCYKETEPKNYMGRVIAIDASMQLYQFMIMVRSSGDGQGPSQQLMNDNGEVTSHLQGFWSRTIRLMQMGIRPVFVFDGKPPELKSTELEKRAAAKAKALEMKAEAEKVLREGDAEEAAGAIEQINKAAKRSVRVSREHNDEVKKLLRLMGLPVVEAPCEAEAQCAELCKKGKVFASATEDMDCVTFATPVLLRRLTMPESRKLAVQEIHYAKALEGLGLNADQFVDLCILCGCDYSSSIKGIGPKNALKLMKEHGSLEAALESLDKAKFTVPEMMQGENLNRVREMFTAPDVTDGSTYDLKFTSPDLPALKKFLVEEKQFDEARFDSACLRLKKTKQQTQQRRMDSFFKVTGGSSGGFGAPAKRKADKAKADKLKKKSAKKARK